MAWYRCGGTPSNVLALPTPSEASGVIAQFNTDLTENLLSAVAEFSASQASGTPTPSAPIPIVGVDKVNVARTGKNLVDIADKSNITIQTTLGTVVLKAGTYALSANVKNNGSISCYLTLRKGSTTKASITVNANEDTRKSTSFTLTETDTYTVVCSGSSAGYDFDVSDLQLEFGSTATDYEEAHVIDKTINLGGTYYGGEVDCVTGKITLTNVYVFSDGTDDTNWNYYSAYGSSYNFRYAYSGLKANGNIICNLLPKGNVGTNREIVAISGNGNNINFEISSSRLNGNTVADLMTFFANNNVQIVAELATPIVVYASNTAEIPTINGFNQVFADTGDVAVKYFETVGHKI